MSDNQTDWKILFAAVVAAVLAIIGPNAAMTIGLVAIPTALFACGRRIFDKEKRNLKMRFIAYGGWALLAISGPGGCALNTFRVERAAVPIISALEQYMLKYGNYPEKLESVASAQCSACSSGKFYYSCKDRIDGYRIDGYRLTAVTYGLNKHTYESKTRKWVDWD